MTFWQGGDKVIETTAANCNNTVVVIHSVGAMLIDDWYQNPNITAIAWAGLPGQESGNSLVDVLYGRISPGKTPFTWAKSRDDYGDRILTEPNNGNGPPQQDLSTSGVFIDYRHFDKYNLTPIYEFGFGLSYTNFSFSNLSVKSLNAPPYIKTTGRTGPAPSFGHVGDVSEYLFPSDIDRVEEFLYPWINSTDLKASSGDENYGMNTFDYIPYGATDGSPQELLPAGGGSGGNKGLWDVLFEVSVTIRNTGNVVGDEVPQLVCSIIFPFHYFPSPAYRDLWTMVLSISYKLQQYITFKKVVQ